MFSATLGDVFQFLAVKERVEFVVRRLMLCWCTNIHVLLHLLADPLRHLGGHRRCFRLSNSGHLLNRETL